MKWYLRVLSKYAVYNGRASRVEYWMFVLINLIIGFALGLIEGLLGIAPTSGQSVFANIYNLVVFIPSLAVAWRRMHDTDRSGWWNLLPLVNIFFLAQEGTKGPNKFGPSPWGNEGY